MATCGKGRRDSRLTTVLLGDIKIVSEGWKRGYHGKELGGMKLENLERVVSRAARGLGGMVGAGVVDGTMGSVTGA
jgi:hypothetical protein